MRILSFAKLKMKASRYSGGSIPVIFAACMLFRAIVYFSHGTCSPRRGHSIYHIE